MKKDSWLGQAQLRYVEEVAWWNGVVSRRDVIEKFSCSGQQASAILQGYLELNSTALEYSTSARRYLSSPRMQCIFESPKFEEEIEKEEDLLGLIQRPVKQVSEEVKRHLIMAMRHDSSVQIVYQSRSDQEPQTREIYPRAFGFDGVRYHVRAWCVKRQAYRDFSLLRMKSVSYPDQVANYELPVDTEWEQWVEVRVMINPDASEGTQMALAEDYNLSSVHDEVVIRCRQAMEKYVLYNLGIDSELSGEGFFRLLG